MLSKVINYFSRALKEFLGLSPGKQIFYGLSGLLTIFGLLGMIDVNRNLDKPAKELKEDITDVKHDAYSMLSEFAKEGIITANYLIDNIESDIETGGPDTNFSFKYATTPDSSNARYGAMVEYDLGKVDVDVAEARFFFKVFDKAIDDNLSQWGDAIRVTPMVIGVADTANVKKGSKYRGQKPLRNVVYHNLNTEEEKKMTLIPNRTLLTNESFAFLRAYNVWEEVKSLQLFDKAPFALYVQEDFEGSDRYSVFIVEIDVREYLDGKYEDLTPMGKSYVEVRNYLKWFLES